MAKNNPYVHSLNIPNHTFGYSKVSTSLGSGIVDGMSGEMRKEVDNRILKALRLMHTSDEDIIKEIMEETEDDIYSLLYAPSDEVTSAYKYKHKL